MAARARASGNDSEDEYDERDAEQLGGAQEAGGAPTRFRDLKVGQRARLKEWDVQNREKCESRLKGAGAAAAGATDGGQVLSGAHESSPMRPCGRLAPHSSRLQVVGVTLVEGQAASALTPRRLGVEGLGPWALNTVEEDGPHALQVAALFAVRCHVMCAFF
jgi:hypothetical protein